MAVHIRRLVAWPLAVVLAFTATGTSRGGEREGWEPLVFELTLSGPVDPNDTFGIEHACRTTDLCAFVERLTIVCSGDKRQQEDWGSLPCAARTYRLELEREAGVTVDYALARWAGSLAGQPSHMLAGSVTVPDGGITLRLGYDYSLPSMPPMLPDTAMPAH
jgi:hypothetical protein